MSFPKPLVGQALLGLGTDLSLSSWLALPIGEDKQVNELSLYSKITALLEGQK